MLLLSRKNRVKGKDEVQRSGIVETDSAWYGVASGKVNCLGMRIDEGLRGAHSTRQYAIGDYTTQLIPPHTLQWAARTLRT